MTLLKVKNSYKILPSTNSRRHRDLDKNRELYVKDLFKHVKSCGVRYVKDPFMYFNRNIAVTFSSWNNDLFKNYFGGGREIIIIIFFCNLGLNI